MSAPVISYNESDIVYIGSVTEKPNPPPLCESHVIDGSSFYLTEDTPLNRRNFMYQPCAANIMLDNLKYCGTEYGDTLGISMMDRSEKLAMCPENGSVSVDAHLGWRSGRNDVCMTEGKIYWEVEVRNLEKDSHIRCGITRREASMETPVGCDFYGYGVRDKGLECIHEGVLSNILEPQQLKQGDRVSFLLELPPLDTQIKQAKEYKYSLLNELNQGNGNSGKRHKKFNLEFSKFLLRNCEPFNVLRDQIAIRYKNQLFYESTDYVKTTKPEYYDSSNKSNNSNYYELDNSSLEVMVNGIHKGVAFRGLAPFLPPFSELQYNEKFYLQHWNKRPSSQQMGIPNKYVNNNRVGYYATLSSFQGGGSAIITDRSDLKYIPADPGIKTLSEIYNEQIASDIVWDIIDEIDVEATSSL